MNLQKLFQGRVRPFGPDHQTPLATRQGRRFLLVLSCAGMLLSAIVLAGCNNYNLNLGAAATYSSQITYLTPSAKVAGGPAFTLTVNGAGFVSGSTVEWDGSSRDTAYVSYNQLTAAITAADICSTCTGTHSILVMSPGTNNGNNFSNTVPFNVVAASSSAASSPSAKAEATTGPGNSYTPAISATHRYVAFAAVSADPSTDGSTGPTQIYMRDTCQGAPQGCTARTILISEGLDGAQPNGASRTPAISADGRFVAFASDASNLVADDTNGMTDIFLRDTCINAPDGCVPRTTLISVAVGGGPANGPSDFPSMSADGRFVAFDSAAGNLVTDGSSAPTGAFLRDTCFDGPDGCVPQTARLAISAPPSQ